MKRLLLALSLLLLMAVPASAKEPDSNYQYRNYMHEIFKNYRDANISIDMKDYGLTDIHLKHLQGNLKAVPPLIPEFTSDWAKLDKELLLQKLSILGGKVADLREAIGRKDEKDIKNLPHEMLNVCLACHADSKLKWLFRLPGHANYFEEYSHGLLDNVNKAEFMLGYDNLPGAEDHLKIALQYLVLLENIPPAVGPTNIVQDRKNFVGEVRKAARYNEMVLEDIKEKKAANLEPLKKQMRNFCVACHERVVFIK